MSTNGPDDQAPPRMPWEPQTPDPGATVPEPPAEPAPGWVPPEPPDPTTVWTPAPPAPPPPAWPTPSGPTPPPDHAGLISSAPVGWAPPPPAMAEVAPGLAFADTTSRAVAYIVDGIILSIVGWILGSILDPTVATVTTTETDLSYLLSSTNPALTVLGFLIDLGYFAISWSGGRRATIGQRLFSIQVGNAFDGRSLTSEQAIRRTLALGGWIGLIGLVPGLGGPSALVGLLWILGLLMTTATSPTKQGLHDRFANTAVVRPSDKRTSGAATACLVIVVVLVLLSVGSAIALYALGDQVSSILSEIGESI